jgi:hypothetical protein
MRVNKLKINFGILISFSILSCTSIFYTMSFVYTNIETLLLVEMFSTILMTINLNLILTYRDYSQYPYSYKKMKFPNYGNFLSKSYWSGIDEEFYWEVYPMIFIFFYVFSLLYGLFFITNDKRNGNPNNNEECLILGLIASIGMHLLFYIMNRRMKKGTKYTYKYKKKVKLESKD